MMDSRGIAQAIAIIVIIIIFIGTVLLWTQASTTQEKILFHKQARMATAKADFDNYEDFLNDSLKLSGEWAAYELGKNGGGFSNTWARGEKPGEFEIKEKLRTRVSDKMNVYEKTVERSGKGASVSSYDLKESSIGTESFSLESGPELSVRIDDPEFKIKDELSLKSKVDLRYVLLYRKVKEYINSLGPTDSVSCSDKKCGSCPDVEDDCESKYKGKIKKELSDKEISTDGIKVSGSISGSFDYGYWDECTTVGRSSDCSCVESHEECETVCSGEGENQECHEECETVCDKYAYKKKTEGTMTGRSINIDVTGEDRKSEILTEDGYKNLKFKVTYGYTF